MCRQGNRPRSNLVLVRCALPSCVAGAEEANEEEDEEVEWCRGGGLCGAYSTPQWRPGLTSWAAARQSMGYMNIQRFFGRHFFFTLQKKGAFSLVLV